MKKYAILVAGGEGLRMGTDTPKQFLLLAGKPVLYHSVQAFLQAQPDVQIILVLPKAHLHIGAQMIEEINDGGRVLITAGGQTRFESVQNGLQWVREESIVFVHDGVRCMVSANLINRCYQQAVEKGSAIPAVKATDTIRMVEHGHHRIVDRNAVYIIQTPQTFQSALLLAAFNQPYHESFTDEASVVEAMGQKVYLIDGAYDNIKITRPIDLLVAEKLLQERLTLKQP